MSLNFKRAVGMPFNGVQSLIALAIGSILLLPAAFMQTHQVSPIWVTGLASLSGLLFSGYQVRVMRAATDESSPGLPSWGGNPADMIMAIVANVLGAIAVAAAYAVIVFVAFAVLFFLGALDWRTVGMPDMTMTQLDASFAVMAIASVAAIPMAAFVPMMQAHYAYEDCVKAVFEWRTIWSVTWSKFWSIIGIALLCGILFGIFEAAVAFFFPLLAIVDFVAATVMVNIFAQIYESARAQG